MNPLLALLAAAVGYLIGSISFARIVTRIVTPGVDLSQTTVAEVPGSDAKLEMRNASVTVVSLRLGPRYAVVVVLLDLLKAAAPTLAFRLLYPTTPYHLVAATACVIGNNWPLYHRFKGGRGMLVAYGGLLVVDWLGVVVTSVGGLLLSLFVIRHVVVTYTVGLWLLIPWLWFRTHDLAHLVYAVAVNVVFLLAALPEARMYFRLKRDGRLWEMSAAMEQRTGMWRRMIRLARRLGLTHDSPPVASAQEEQDLRDA